MTAYHECKKCGFEIEMDVDLGEHMIDIPEECPECKYKFTNDEKEKIYSDALDDAWGSAIDYAHDRIKDI